MLHLDHTCQRHAFNPPLISYKLWRTLYPVDTKPYQSCQGSGAHFLQWRKDPRIRRGCSYLRQVLRLRFWFGDWRSQHVHHSRTDWCSYASGLGWRSSSWIWYEGKKVILLCLYTTHCHSITDKARDRGTKDSFGFDHEGPNLLGA